MVKSKPFAVFDIDGTLIRWQMLHVIYDWLGRAGLIAENDFAAIRAARLDWKKRKAIDSFRAYEDVLYAIVARSIAGITPKIFEQAAQEAFNEYRDQTYRYTRGLIRDLKQKGYFVIAISGSPDEVVKHLAEYYGFDDYAATVQMRQGGRYTGEIMVAAMHKPELLRELMAKHDLDFAGSIGVGDSEGDISMLEMVEHPIAFNPSKGLFLHAEKHHWKVVVERKNMIYEFEPKDGHYRLARTNAEE